MIGRTDVYAEKRRRWEIQETTVAAVVVWCRDYCTQVVRVSWASKQASQPAREGVRLQTRCPTGRNGRTSARDGGEIRGA